MEPQAQNVVQALAALPPSMRQPAPNSAYAIGQALGMPNLTPEMLQRLLQQPMYAQPVVANRQPAVNSLKHILSGPNPMQGQ